MIDVLFLCCDDWANTGWRMMKAVQTLGLKVMGFKGNPHVFGYPEQLVILSEIANTKPFSALSLNNLAENTKVIHFIASTYIDTGVDLSQHHVVVNHGGRVYRENSVACNGFFNRFADAAICQTPDLLGLGANNEHLIYFPVDTDNLKPVYKEKGVLTIGHFPSIPWKGTGIINGVIDSLAKKHELEYVSSGKDDRTIWLEQLDRIRHCDILIDNIAVTAKYADASPQEFKYGTWGNVSMEAAALGKVPVSCALDLDVYQREYGDCGITVANDADQLYDALERLLLMKSDEFVLEQMKARRWVEEKHSLKATGRRLWDKVYKPFFESTPETGGK